MSRATSFASVTQQVSLSLGVALGALILQARAGFAGEATITQFDFALAFWIVAAISAISVASFLRLPTGAGERNGRNLAPALPLSPLRQAPRTRTRKQPSRDRLC